MSKDDLIPAEGVVVDKQPNAFFKVRPRLFIDGNLATRRRVRRVTQTSGLFGSLRVH